MNTHTAESSRTLAQLSRLATQSTTSRRRSRSRSRSRSRTPFDVSNSTQSRSRSRSRSRSPSASGPTSHPVAPGKTAVFVSNLSPNVRACHLSDIFSWYGQVVQIHLSQTKRCAHVRMSTVQDASKAVVYMKGGQIDGLPIDVRCCTWPEDLPSSRDRGSVEWRTSHKHHHHPEKHHDHQRFINDGSNNSRITTNVKLRN